MAAARKPGFDGGISSGATDTGTLARTRSPVPASTGIGSGPALRSPISRQHSRRGTPPVTATHRTIAISMDVITISARRVNVDEQLTVANEVFAPCGVQFYIAGTYTADDRLSRRAQMVEGYWRSERDDYDPMAVQLAHDFARMSGRIKVFLVRSTGVPLAFSVPFSLDARHGSLGLRAYLSDNARPDTLAHELGHIFLNDADANTHAADPANLMAGADTRTGRALTPDQQRQIQQSARAIAGLP